MRSRDTSPEAARAQLAVYRRMSPTERLRAGLELTRLSRELIAQGIRRRHPDYSDDQVGWALILVWLGRDLYARAYPGRPLFDP